MRRTRRSWSAGVPSLLEFDLTEELHAADNRGSMVWFFERQDSRLRYEIRRAPDGPAFELVITHPDGREEIERFQDSAAVVRRSEYLQSALVEAGWRSPASKALLRPRA